MSPSSNALNGCLVFHSGCSGAIALTRSKAKASWKYIGCSDHSVPSLSNVAMRSVGRDEIRTALGGDARDEIGDRLLDRAVVPGRQRIGLSAAQRIAGRESGRDQGRRRLRAERTGSTASHDDSAWLTKSYRPARQRAGINMRACRPRLQLLLDHPVQSATDPVDVNPPVSAFFCLMLVHHAFQDVGRIEARRERARREILERRHELRRLRPSFRRRCRHG